MMKAVLIAIAVTIVFLSALSQPFAQKYPDHPINLVIPMSPGDGLDVAGRLMADELSKLLKVAVTVTNKPGASGTLGTDFVVKSKKDGYTILFTNASSVCYTKALQPEIVPYCNLSH